MYNCGSGKIMESELCQPAVSPYPVSRYRIDHQTYHQTVDTICCKFSSRRHGTRHDGRRRRSEYCLKYQECPEWDSVRKHAASIYRFHCHTFDLTQYSSVAAIHNSESYQPERPRTDTIVNQILHGDISCIFYPRHAGLKHRKARLHEENEYRSYHNPYRTDCTIFHHDSSLISVISVLPCDSEPYVPVIPLSPPGAPSYNVHPHIYSVYRTDIPASALPDQVYHLA